MGEVVGRVLGGDSGAEEELVELGAADPVGLRPYLGQLLGAEGYLPTDLFRAGQDDFQRSAMELADSGTEDRHFVVAVLSETRGPVVEEAFRRWRAEPPGMTGEVFTRLIGRNGWDFDEDGRPRASYGTTAGYELAPGQGEQEPADGACPWCGGALWTALDVDTADPRVSEALAHTGWRGRLRVVSCYLCCCYGTTYAEVTPDGGSVWSSAHTVKPGYLDGRTLEAEEPPATRLTVGAARPAYRLGGYEEAAGTSTLGGRPWWIQDPDVPPCPACGRLMGYVAAVTGADVGEHGVGVCYLFVHPRCGLAATVSQFS